jgi:hypothetical protein
MDMSHLLGSAGTGCWRHLLAPPRRAQPNYALPADLTARARIRDAALRLFGEQGFDQATIRGIAEAAGVSSCCAPTRGPSGCSAATR